MDETGEDVVVSGRRRTAGIGSGWWVHHVSLAIAFWIALPLFAAAYLLSGPSSMLGVLGAYGIASVAFVVFVTMWGALIGYYYDARALRRAGADWVPRWWVWTLLHLPFWPVVAPLYVFERHRRLGGSLPDLPVLGSG